MEKGKLSSTIGFAFCCLLFLLSGNAAFADDKGYVMPDGRAMLLPPVAVDDENYGPEDIIQTGDVSLNDSDPDGDALTYALIIAPIHGDLALASNGTYVYTPDPEYVGFDYATYEVCDPGGLCDQAVIEFAMTFVNDLPVANNDTFTAFENTQLSGSVSLNDYDLDDEPNFASVLDAPDHASAFVLNTNGTFTYTPVSGFIGIDTFVYQQCDPCGACDFAIVTINVLPPNYGPEANDDDIFTAEDFDVSGDVGGNDNDPNNDELTFSVLTQPIHGTLMFDPNGLFTYSPFPDYYGSDSFTYLVCDIYDACDEGFVSITVQFVNDPPDAVDDFASTNEDTVLSGSVALNDTDPDIESHNFFMTTGTTHGTIEILDDGSYTYTPVANYFGPDQAVYLMIDPCGVMDIATLFIDVLPVNDAPIAAGEQVTTNEDVMYSGSVAGNEMEIEGETMLWTVISGPTHGVLVLNPNGSFTYTPNQNYFGTDEVMYSVADPLGASASAVLGITIVSINDLPIAEDDFFSLDEDASLSGSVAINDVDPDNDPLEFTLVNGALNGTLEFFMDGTFNYTPFADYHGTEIMSYEVCDNNGGCSNAALTIEVMSVNDIPLVENEDFSVFEDFVLIDSVADNDMDPDGDVLTYNLVTSVVNGNLQWNADGTFTYTPDLNYFGTETITYEACDPSNACAQGVATIEVIFVNDLPITVDDDFTMNEDEVFEGNVSLNDIEYDPELLFYFLMSTAQHGTLEFNDDGTFTYTPNGNYFGTETVTYMACDPCGACDIAELVIHIEPVNDAPVANNDNNTVLVNVTLNGTVAGNDSDVDGDALTFNVIEDAVSGSFTLNANGSYSYVPDAFFVGWDQITYEACDPMGLCDTAVLLIEVVSTNGAPVLVDDVMNTNEDELLSATVAANDTDPDGDELIYTMLEGPDSGICFLQQDGSFTYTPEANFHGTVVITYRACDPFGECPEATLTINVISVNDAPVAMADIDNIMEDAQSVGTVATNDYDVDLDELTYTILNGPENGVIDMQADGSYTYTPDPNYFGSEVMVYEVCDGGGLCDNAILTIDVLFVNDWPVAEDDFFYTEVNTQITGTVAANDIELDPELLTYETLTDAVNGVLILNEDGTFSYLPNDGFVGTESVYYIACDPCGACDEALLTIVVSEINTAPTANDGIFEGCQDTNFVVDLDLYISDAEEANQDLVISDVSTSNGTWELEGHVLTVVPGTGFSGTLSVEYTVCDNGAESLCSSALIEMEVQANFDPVIASVNIGHSMCFEDFSGYIDLTMEDSEFNYLFSWRNDMQEEDIDYLNAGTYDVSITSDAACAGTIVESFVVEGPDAPLEINGLDADPIDETAGGSGDYTVSGGTEPYTYAWRDSEGNLVSESATLGPFTDPSEAGSYTLEVTDANGCVVFQTISITGIAEWNSDIAVQVYPNPMVQEAVISMDGMAGRDISIRIFETTGRCVFSREIMGVSDHMTIPVSVENLSAGMYQLQVFSNELRAHVQMIVLR